MKRSRVVRWGTFAVLAWLTVFVSPTADADTTDTQVLMADFGFDPAEITVPLGATVTWVYDDPQCDAIPICPGHDTRAEVDGPDGQPLWRSPVIKGEGKTFTATMTQVGRIPYICTIHQTAVADMDGVINVVAAAGESSTTDTVVGSSNADDATATSSSGSPISTSVAGSSSGSAAASKSRSTTLPETGSTGAHVRSGLGLLVLAAAAAFGARTLRAPSR